MWLPPTSKDKDNAWPCALNALDNRAEIDDVERNELLGDKLALRLLKVDLHPVSGNVAVVIVGGQRVELRTVLLHRPRDKVADLLRRRHAGAEDILVADAAFILLVVKIERPVLVDDRADRLA